MSEAYDWSPPGDHQRIIVRDVDLKIRCGLHAHEQDPEKPNRVIISVELYSKTLFDAGTQTGYIDYDEIYQYLLSLEGQDHVDLLETLLTKVTDKSFEHPLVDACRVRVMKPEIFSRASGAGVEWFRTRPS